MYLAPGCEVHHHHRGGALYLLALSAGEDMQVAPDAAGQAMVVASCEAARAQALALVSLASLVQLRDGGGLGEYPY